LLGFNKTHILSGDGSGLKLPYSQHKYVWCQPDNYVLPNITDSGKIDLKEYNNTLPHAGEKTPEFEVKQMCMFKKDDLFSIIILDDRNMAQRLKQVNRESSKITREALQANVEFNNTLYGWYYFSAEVGIFNLAESPHRRSHQVKEHFIILSTADLKMERTMDKLPGDLDLAIVNQILMTFMKSPMFV